MLKQRGFVACGGDATGGMLCQNPHRYVEHLPMQQSNAVLAYICPWGVVVVRQHIHEGAELYVYAKFQGYIFSFVCVTLYYFIE